MRPTLIKSLSLVLVSFDSKFMKYLQTRQVQFILFVFTVFFVTGMAGWYIESTAEETERPNIIFILTDDLGYGDLGVFHQNKRAKNGKPHHRTPHLDSLATNGVRLTRHYTSAPICAPARATLLRGVHQGNAEVRDNQWDKELPDNHTLGTMLREAGYATAAIGKWGLQGEDVEEETPETWPGYPTKRGFEFFLGYVRHGDGHNHYPAHQMPRRGPKELYQQDEEISDKARGAYTTDIFTAAAKQWIKKQKDRNPDQPFFMYLAYDTPHAGLEVPPSPYPEGGGLNGGVQWVGETGKLVNSADPTNVDGYFHPDYTGRGWPETEVRLATMIRRIDNSVGDLHKLLADLDIDENTLIVFSSDNGPHSKSYGYGKHDPTFFDSFGELDGIKRDTWEGGSRMPTWAFWPEHIPEGREVSEPSQFHDWMPTFADAAGIPAPAVSDGVSLLPELTGNGEGRESTVYIEYKQNGKTPSYEEFDPSRRGRKRGQMQMLYLDGYKGIRTNIQSADDPFEIYDTKSDPGERNNLAKKGGKFDQLQQRMQERVLQLRRPNQTAERPYDDAPMPAVNVNGLASGLSVRCWEIKTPWVPQPAMLGAPAHKGTFDGFGLDSVRLDAPFVLAYEGFIRIPETGEYTFNVPEEASSVFRVHDATLIDTDQAGSEDTYSQFFPVHLEAGLHPIQLVYTQGEEENPGLNLTWDGPGVDGSVPEGRLFHKP